MKTYKVVNIKKTIEDKVHCDICNSRIVIEPYDAHESKIEIRTGSAYQDGGWGIKHTVDICPKCVESFISLLTTNGVRVNSTEWDY